MVFGRLPRRLGPASYVDGGNRGNVLLPGPGTVGMNDTDDWFDVERLDERSWRISEGVVFHTYLLAGDDRAVLVDAALGVGDLRSVVEDLVDVPVTVLLTHSHWDHMGAAHQFDDVLIHDFERGADGRVTSHQVADVYPADFDGWAAQWRDADQEFPDGFDPDGYEIPPATGVEPVRPGATLDLGGRSLEIVHVPGHSPGLLGALDRDAGDLYASDVVHIDYSIYAHFGGCDLVAYEDTLAGLSELRHAGAFDTLYTGHNRPLSGDDLSLIDEFHDGVVAILADDLDYEPVDGELTGRRYEVAGQDVLTKPGVS